MSGSTAVAEQFLACLERLDARPIEALLTEDVVQSLPLAASGGPQPAAVFEGKVAVMEVQLAIVNTFSRVAFDDAVFTESADGRTVFVESAGERLHRETGQAYRNRYVFKFEFRDSLISRITEYSNPVSFAMFFGRPIG